MLAAKRCGEVMDDPTNVGDEQITSPNDVTDVADVRPGGKPFESDNDREVIDISLVNEDFASAEVTEVIVASSNGIETGVGQVEIWYKTVDGDDTYVPYTPSAIGATVPQTFDVTDDTPLVINIPVKVTDIRIVVIKEDSADKMSFDIKVHACLHPGKNTLLCTVFTRVVLSP